MARWLRAPAAPAELTTGCSSSSRGPDTPVSSGTCTCRKPHTDITSQSDEPLRLKTTTQRRGTNKPPEISLLFQFLLSAVVQHQREMKCGPGAQLREEPASARWNVGVETVPTVRGSSELHRRLSCGIHVLSLVGFHINEVLIFAFK